MAGSHALLFESGYNLVISFLQRLGYVPVMGNREASRGSLAVVDSP